MRTVAEITATRPKAVLIVSTVLLVAAGAVGTAVIPRMSGGGYDDPGSDSSQVAQLLKNNFELTDPHLSLAIGVDGYLGAVDSDKVAAVAEEVAADISVVKGVSEVTSYWNSGASPQLRSEDGQYGLLMVYLSAEKLDRLNAISTEIIDATPAEVDGVEIHIGGPGAIYTAVNSQITEDIAFAETISIPLTLIMLLIVFGAAVAAAMPLMVGLSAIAGAMLGVLGVSYLTDVSVFALNLITGLGLGLGIDYALLIVNRFREEMAKQNDVEQAVRTTVHTAGRTVMVSGLTVALTLAAMIVFPQPFLRSFAYAGVLVCLMAVVGALVPLPASLRLLGRHIDRWRIRRGSLAPSDHGAWATVARGVMRHPWITTVVTVAALGALASLATSAKFGQVDDRVLPADNPAAVASQVFREHFNSYEGSPVEVIFRESETPQIAAFATAASKVGTVVRVETPAGIYTDGTLQPMPPETGWPFIQMAADGMTRLRVIADVEPRSPAGEDLVWQLRALDPEAEIGGSAGIYSDSQAGVADNVPRALLWVAIATLILLFLFTGSVLLPIKAVLLNLLSLGATVGVLTWLFQNGHLQWLTGDYTVTGQLDTSTLVLIIIVTFGLSMDYEVFLLSRIKEEHDVGADTVDAVALGLQRSGRIITAAAALLAVVFAAFVTSSVTSIKMMGIGIGFAILLDATVVRGLLVPALMRIAGRYNWWAPRPLRAFHARFGISD